MDLQPSHHPSSPQQHPKSLFYIPFLSSIDISHALVLLLILITSVVVFNGVRPFEPRSLPDFDFLYQILPGSQNSACDFSYGKWVWDESYPRQKYAESCPFLDPGFRCQQNGRRDTNYQKWRWKPHGCDLLPRFNATALLSRYQNRRIVFAGDSIGRNQWESMVCMLAQGVSNQSTIYEVNGKPITKHKGFLLMRFGEYNLTVEYYRVPFIVVIDRPPHDAPKIVRGAIRVDKMHWFSTKWVGADVLVFSSGHWWNADKTVKAGHYFQEGKTMNMTMDVTEAFRRTLNTLMKWAMQNLNPQQSQIFFRSYSPVHYRGGAWNEGGHCEIYVTPEKDLAKLEVEPFNNIVTSEVIKQMKSAHFKAQFLNITYLTELRRDGHPSLHREPGMALHAPQDCSHWCLPGALLGI